MGSKIKMYAYHLERFQSDLTSEEHTYRRRKTQKMESQIIALFRKNGRKVINQKSSLSFSVSDCPYLEILNQVVGDFDLSVK